MEETEIKINKIELACNLADEDVLSHLSGTEAFLDEEDLFIEVNGVNHYHPDAQDYFEERYNHYLEKIEECQIN